jgi:hypothetical protein
VKEIPFEIEDEQYERLRELKKHHGLTWKGVLLQGGKRLDSGEQQPNCRRMKNTTGKLT